MNQDQTVSLVTKLLVSAATAVTIKWGLSASETQDIVTDAVTAVVGIGTIIFSHVYNKTDTTK
jgi:hypothetical protein